MTERKQGAGEKKKASEKIYNALKEDILHLVFLPGSTISETEIAAKYNVSRTPVRDAFKALEKEELLEVRPQVGTFISYIDMNQISDLLFMREALEQAILKILCTTYTHTQILKMKLALKEQKQMLENHENLTNEEYNNLGTHFLKLDNEFHYLLFELAGKGEVWKRLVETGYHYERFRTLVNWGKDKMLLELYEQHCEIIDFIIKKDIESVTNSITEHIYSGFTSSTEVVVENSTFFSKNRDLFTL